MSRRYVQYPELAHKLENMPEEARELVAWWHRSLITAAENSLVELKAKTAEAYRGIGASETLAEVASGSAQGAIEGWLRIMRAVAGLIVEPVGDWCCKRGMEAFPTACPQHGFRLGVDYPLGTIVREAIKVNGIQERAIKVKDESEDPHPWVSIDYAIRYSDQNMAKGLGWTVIGHA